MTKTSGFTMSRRSLVASAAALGLVTATSLRASAQQPPMATPTAPGNFIPVTLGENEAAIAVVHAASAAPAVDILINGQPAVQGVEFGAVGEFLIVDAAEYQVQVVPGGGQPTAALIDTTVTVEAGKVYAVVATNGTEAPEVLAFEIDNAPVSDGNARVIAIHASPDVPSLDIAPVGGEVAFSALEYGNASDAADLPAGPLELEARAAGEGTVLATVSGVELMVGTSVAIVLTTDATGMVTPLVVGTKPGNESDPAISTPAA